jgi:hypothetical protein
MSTTHNKYYSRLLCSETFSIPLLRQMSNDLQFRLVFISFVCARDKKDISDNGSFRLILTSSHTGYTILITGQQGFVLRRIII